MDNPSYFGKGDDGVGPVASPVIGENGSLYGTATGRGAGFAGVVYRVTPGGQETVVYAFKNGEDGSQPTGITLDKKANMYGVTVFGGHYGLGTLFKITPRGKEIQLHAFAEDQTDGGEPDHGVIFDKAGNLYGSTPWGGASNLGTIYKLTPQGEYNVLYSFPGGAAGATPRPDLLMDKAGNFYGTASGGGDYGWGTVFEFSPSGTETVLHSFTGGGDGDGAYPGGGLVADRHGNFYGTTTGLGTGGPGNVYQLAPDGIETVLHAFTGGKDGDGSCCTLAMDGVGNLYGTAGGGGFLRKACDPYGCGTVFTLPMK